MVIYVSFDENGDIDGWGTSPANDRAIEIDIEDDHPFLDDIPERYTLESGVLTKKADYQDIGLKYSKEVKKEELSDDCQLDILSGFNHSIGGQEYHFSYDREAQANLQERWQIFQNDMVEEMNITAHLGKEDVRLTVDKEIFSKIYVQSVMAKENKIKKLREDLFPLVERAKSQTELDVIKWDMEVIEPKPESIVLKDDKTLDKEVKRVEASTAMSNAEMLNLIFMSQAGVFGGMMNLSGLTESGGDVDV